jgi:hypothetical protein
MVVIWLRDLNRSSVALDFEGYARFNALHLPLTFIPVNHIKVLSHEF